MSKDHDQAVPIRVYMLGLMELVYVYPLIVLLSVFGLSMSPVYTFILLGIGLLAAIWLRSAIHNRLMAGSVSFIAGMIISGIGTLLFQANQTLIPVLLAAVAGAGAAFRGFSLGNRRLRLAPADRLQYTGLISLLALSVIATRVPILDDHTMSIYAAGIIGFLVYVWTRHSREMRRATLDMEGKRPQIKSFSELNRTRMLLFLVIVIILGSFNYLSELFNYLWNGFTSWFRTLFDGEPSEEIPETIPQLPSEGLLFPPAEAEPSSEPSPVWDWVLNALVMLAVLAFLLLIGYGLWRLLKKVSAYLQSRSTPQDEAPIPERIAYIDITETIENRPKKDFFRKFRKQRVPVEPEQRIRYYYKSVIEQAGKEAGPPPSSLTPNELGKWLTEHKEIHHRHFPYREELLHQLIALYNKVRYGEQQISPEEIQPLDQAHK
ncbi:DUF4129 domain-containing protein [Paenibacillus urinalis]|uniref:DUF4129 domain-containing protein n=1 Tax=Paenibacillus urinalis TaxID=521520 RepID=A0AAX3N670_9BACL|nr:MULTISPECIES: DUF4129 domain-containing protein [Paenibacillus]WDH84157.1 DUF4129 domain-containing protein [Paenibacillus urinalis]WDH95600.1 DUF4129 domain-containing protein [Paenibacillus urinalis]WDI03797.1 DUF4129 domain-containing protein [Paenibacillus urinalis]GAK38862.1 hypothetical protein TCA2_0588 [Paenibacillus sp. TCA20]